MTRPSPQLLLQLLETPPARAWLGQLTAAFFDREAKAAVLDAVRAGLPALAPGLDPDALRQLGDGLVQELCRQASRDALPPAEDAPGPAPLAGHTLEDQILTAYPYPVAAAYHALTEQDSAAGGFGCLLDTFGRRLGLQEGQVGQVDLGEVVRRAVEQALSRARGRV
jgi:hypothetical protein